MDIFPVYNPVQHALQPPVESLEVRGYQQGVQTAQQLPSTAQAISQGVVQGIANYREGVRFEDEQQLNDIKMRSAEQELQINQIKLEQAAELAPQETASLAEDIQAKRDQYARDVKLRQDEDEFLEILRSGNAQQTADALLSGRYVGVFAANPKLEREAVRAAGAGGALTSQQLNAFLDGKYLAKNEEFLRKNRQKLLTDYNKASAEYLEADAVRDILATNPDVTPVYLARNADIVPTGTRQFDAQGLTVYDEALGTPVQVEPEIKIPGQDFDVIDRKTGKLLASGITKADAQKIYNFRTASRLIGPEGAASNDDLEATVLSELKRAKKPAAPAPTEAGSQASLMDKILASSKKSAPVAANINLTQLKQQLGKTDLVHVTGAPAVDSSEELPVLMLSSLPVSAEVSKNYLGDMQAILQDYSIRKDFSYTDAEKLAATKRIAEKSNQLASNLLIADWNTNKANYVKTYNDQAVENHNRAVGNYSKQLATSATTGVQLAAAPTGWPNKVQSPSDLYVLYNQQSVVNRINASLSQLDRSITEQQIALTNRRKSGNALVSTFAYYFGGVK